MVQWNSSVNLPYYRGLVTWLYSQEVSCYIYHLLLEVSLILSIFCREALYRTVCTIFLRFSMSDVQCWPNWIDLLHYTTLRRHGGLHVNMLRSLPDSLTALKSAPKTIFHLTLTGASLLHDLEVIIFLLIRPSGTFKP